MAIHIDFACNNPDCGHPVGKFHRLNVEVGADFMEFEGPIYQSDGVTLMVDSSGRFAKIGRLTVDILGYHAWAGNWCWDRISVAWPEALKIINYLGSLEKQGWHMSCGPTELFDAFNARHAITPAEWKANNEQRHATR